LLTVKEQLGQYTVKDGADKDVSPRSQKKLQPGNPIDALPQASIVPLPDGDMGPFNFSPAALLLPAELSAQ